VTGITHPPRNAGVGVGQEALDNGVERAQSITVPRSLWPREPQLAASATDTGS
jgi:hypothetical protein